MDLKEINDLLKKRVFEMVLILFGVIVISFNWIIE